MRSPSGPTRHALQLARKQSAGVIELCDAVTYGGASNRPEALRLIQPALRLLIIRAQAALTALEQEP